MVSTPHPLSKHLAFCEIMQKNTLESNRPQMMQLDARNMRFAWQITEKNTDTH